MKFPGKDRLREPGSPHLAKAFGVAALFSVFLCPAAMAQPAVYESEPNNTPAGANIVSGEVTIMGTMQGNDQDGFSWSVSDVDARKRWTLELHGIPGILTIVEVIRLEYADNGVDIASATTLFTIGSRDGIKPARAENLYFDPGDYILGVASAGGGDSPFRPEIDSLDFDETGEQSAPTAAGDETGGYRLVIREGKTLPMPGKPPDNASRETAHKARFGTYFSSFSHHEASWLRFDVNDNQAEQLWTLDGQVPVGHSATAFLRDAQGGELSSTDADRRGKFSFPDLGLEAGVYYLEIRSPEGAVIRAIESDPVGEVIKGVEFEPNDKWTQANQADLSQPVTGRMGRQGESDYFRFNLDKTTADQLLILRLETGADQQMQLCLHDAENTRVQCRSGQGTVELPDLVLQPGEWGLAAERGPEGAEYRVTLSAQGPIQAGMEAEPNDVIGFASAVPSNNRVKGRFSSQEDDYYRIMVTGEPQLWRFQVIGDEIHELAYYDGAGIQNQNFRVPPGQRRVRLDNVFLLPGTHHVRVTGRDGGRYTLMARPIGPPDPHGEFEPNDDTSRMLPLRFGQTRTGLLEDMADRDNYRFYLDSSDHIRLTIQAPPDGEIKADLYWDKEQFKQFNRPQKGQKVVLEGLFPPGDYRLNLIPQKTSEAEYSLSLERLDRFACASDCEPNDNIDFANPLPANHILEGRANEWRDPDWYALPVFDQATAITLRSEPRHHVEVVERLYYAQSYVTWDNDAKLWSGTIPPGINTYIQVAAQGDTPYRFEVDFPGGPAAHLEPGELPVDISMELETSEIGAYRKFGQKISGQLNISNNGAETATLALEAATSSYRWMVDPNDTMATIPAGQQFSMPLIIHAPADVRADWPVRISLRASNESGAQVETSAEVRAGRETPPVNPQYGWTLPEPLRGGFNVAWNALGGRWTGEENSAIGTGFPFLNDGMAVEQQGLRLRGGTEAKTIEYIVELAGSTPVDVVGLAINETGGTSAPDFLGNIDFALSMDGETFSPALHGTLMPIRAEQVFVLDQAVKARYARLQIKRGFSGQVLSSLGFGELKVIAKPGFDLSGGVGFNLADPSLGGHVAWSAPQISYSNWDEILLKDETKSEWVRLKQGQNQEFAIGFHHARAARISRIEWLESEDSEDAAKFRQVSLSASLDSPVGPWEPVGDWDLTSSGSPAVFEPDQPVWARYVKFSAAGGNETGNAKSPSLIRIWEQPTGGEYRSILTEWGHASQEAIYEALHPLRVDKPFEAAGHGSRATAASIEPGQLAGGQVVLGKHEHWYRIDMPAGQNTLTLSLSGDPTVRTVAALENDAGEAIPLRRVGKDSTPRLHSLAAIVNPGEHYFLKIEEPPRNVVFLWDTSASVGAYLPVIYNAMMAYMADVVPGKDAANLIPFGSDLLLGDWYGEPYVLQTVLNDYPRKESSSEAEGTLHTATRALAPRAGTKAIVMVTDAATNRHAPVWDEFMQVQPRIFSLGVGSQGALGRNPPLEQDLMQDWSRVNGGHYAHLLSEGEMEVAFDRASTMLRRPAGYTLEVTGSFTETPGPGSLQVISTEGATGSGGAVELILDASGSMLKRMDGKRRIAIAKEVLSQVVNEHIPSGTPVALRVFGHKEAGSCRTDLEIALQPLDPAAASAAIQGVNAMNLAKTPIADSLAKVESDLKTVAGRKVVVLVTDGEETCDGDPEKVINQLREKGFDATLNIVGFAIDDAALENQFQGWARLSGGRYFSASSQEGLSESIQEALKVPYSVFDAGGTLAGEGLVGGEPLELEQGFYRVVVETSPPTTFERVEIPGEEEILLELGGDGI